MVNLRRRPATSCGVCREMLQSCHVQWRWDHTRIVLGLWLYNKGTILVDNLLHVAADELIEGVQLLPHQALLIKEGGDDCPCILLRCSRCLIKLYTRLCPGLLAQGAHWEASVLSPSKHRARYQLGCTWEISPVFSSGTSSISVSSSSIGGSLLRANHASHGLRPMLSSSGTPAVMSLWMALRVCEVAQGISEELGELYKVSNLSETYGQFSLLHLTVPTRSSFHLD